MYSLPLERNALQQLKGTLPADRDANISNGLGFEPSLTITEVVLPNMLV